MAVLGGKHDQLPDRHVVIKRTFTTSQAYTEKFIFFHFDRAAALKMANHFNVKAGQKVQYIVRKATPLEVYNSMPQHIREKYVKPE